MEGWAELATIIINCRHNPREARAIGDRLIKRGREARDKLIMRNYESLAGKIGLTV